MQGRLILQAILAVVLVFGSLLVSAISDHRAFVEQALVSSSTRKLPAHSLLPTHSDLTQPLFHSTSSPLAQKSPEDAFEIWKAHNSKSYNELDVSFQP